jgi:hypothetical protein
MILIWEMFSNMYTLKWEYNSIVILMIPKLMSYILLDPPRFERFTGHNEQFK